MPTKTDKLKALFFGPGWNPGTPRLGDENDIPEKTVPRQKYNPQTPVWIQIYLFIHFVIVILVQQLIMSYFSVSILNFPV